MDLIKHPKVHSKYAIKSIPSQTCICTKLLSDAVGVFACLYTVRYIAERVYLWATFLRASLCVSL